MLLGETEPLSIACFAAGIPGAGVRSWEPRRLEGGVSSSALYL